MKERILKEIKKIELEKGIKVLFAIESGSRAWGWESDDSDYDIRGVFIREKTLFENPEQISLFIDELDIELWSIEKFLKLMIKSNPSVWEWLSSDIVYIENELRIKLKDIFERNFSKYALKKHYVSMARQNFEKYINGIGDKANLKKYTYILRSVACVDFIQAHDSPPPKNYLGVINYLPFELKKFLEKIVIDKKKSESLVGNRNRDAEKYIINYFNKEFENDWNSFSAEELEVMYKKIKLDANSQLNEQEKKA